MLFRLTALLLSAGQTLTQDAAVRAVAALIDPAKLATLRGDRAANLRVLKCVD
jgi:hypothetical protein